MKNLLTGMFLGLIACSSAWASETSTKLMCVGTEPFWNLTVGEKFLIYNSPLISDEATLINKRLNASNTPADLVQVIKTKYTSLTIVGAANCQDGMSDEIYTYHAVYEREGQVFYGCCR